MNQVEKSKFIGLRAKTNSYLDDGKKAKGTKKCFIKRTVENHKNWIEATKIKNKINYQEINEIGIDSFFCFKRRHKEFIKTIN